MQAARFRIGGRVQGVGFRAAVRRRALEFGLSGYARNLVDGSVEVLAQGELANIDALHHWLHRGPPHARVDDVRREPAVVGAVTGFDLG